LSHRHSLTRRVASAFVPFLIKAPIRTAADVTDFVIKINSPSSPKHADFNVTITNAF